MFPVSSKGGDIVGLFASPFSWVFCQGGVWMAVEVLDMVDAEEDPGDFENKRRSPYFELSVGLSQCRRIYWYIFGGKISGA